MAGQPSLWDAPDPAGASTARTTAIAKADAHAPDEFKTAAAGVLEQRAYDGQPFTADDIWSALQAAGAPMPPTPAALGPIVQAAARKGRIVKTGLLVRTVYAHRHRDLVQWIGVP